MRVLKDNLTNKVRNKVKLKMKVLLESLKKDFPNDKFLIRVDTYRVFALGYITYKVLKKDDKTQKYSLCKTIQYNEIPFPIDYDTTELVYDKGVIKDLKVGDWLFSCSMKPLQFSHYNFKDRKNWDKNYFEFTDDEQHNELAEGMKAWDDSEWDDFNYDDFETLEGSHHSQRHCTLKRITQGYGEWFLANDIDKLFDKHIDASQPWEAYEREIRKLCFRDGIKYEGY